MSSDERREVAARLRSCAREVNGTRDFSMYLSHWVGFDGITDDKGNPFTIQANRREAELTLEKLADLIDPTCSVVWKHTGSYPYEACSVCGGAFEHAPSYYAYCPNCGARVVDE